MLRRRVPLLLAAVALLLSHATRAQHAPPPGPGSLPALAAAIDAQLAAPRFAGAHWGIEVISLDSGRTLYAHDADVLAQPASTGKLYTAALALAMLGPQARLSTQLLAGTATAGVLDGPLLLRGGGDPSLGTQDASPDWADQFAAALAASGVRAIRGDLIADDTAFAGPPFGSGWEAGDLQSAFAAPPAARSVDENTVTVTVDPAASVGQPASIALTPAQTTLTLDDALTTAPARTPEDINLYRAHGEHVLHAFGSLPLDAKTHAYDLSMADPAQVAGRALAEALARHGIRLDGVVRSVHWPTSTAALRARLHVVGQLASPTVMELLHTGLKRSENLYLQNLLLAVGTSYAVQQADAPGSPTGYLGSEAWGIRALRALLERIGIAPSASLIEDGAGLSRRDLTTPDALTKLLVYLAAQPYAEQLRDALPVAGEDGTLAYRMRDSRAAGDVHAKTGSMTYVRCLAGYLTTAAGERIAFAIMLDNYQPPDGMPPGSRELDRIVELLAGLRARSG